MCVRACVAEGLADLEAKLNYKLPPLSFLPPNTHLFTSYFICLKRRRNKNEVEEIGPKLAHPANI